MPEDKQVDNSAERLGSESAYEDETELKRRMRRGDESQGDPNERDVAGDYQDDESTGDTALDQGLTNRNQGKNSNTA